MKKIIFVLFIFLTACGAPAVSPTATRLSPSDTPAPSLTPTITASPTITLTPTITPDPNVLVDEQGVTMRLIPAGEFTMGANVDDFIAACSRYLDTRGPCQKSWFDIPEPARQIYLDAYFMDAYEVTNARYMECVDVGVCTPPAREIFVTIEEYYGNPEYDNYPVVYVDQAQSQAYCSWRGGSLPTQAQWEKAARGPEAFYFPWGNDMEDGAANFCDLSCKADQTFDDGFGLVAPVGSFERDQSGYGIYDMAGNVIEWTADYHDENYFQNMPASNPTGPESGNTYVLRGGRYDAVGGGFPSIINSYDYRIPTFNSWVIGFRCARPAP